MDDEDNHVDDQHAQGQEDAADEQHEVAVVSFPDTGAHETAVVVKYLNAVAACRTVTRPLRSKDVTGAAKASSRGIDRSSLDHRDI